MSENLVKSTDTPIWELTSRVEYLNKRLVNSFLEISELSKKVTSLEENNQVISSKMLSLEDEVQKGKEEREELKAEILEHLKTISDKNELIEKLYNEIKKLKEDKEFAENVINEFRNQLELQRQELLSIKASHELEKQQHAENAQAELEALQDELSVLRNYLKEKDIANSSLKKENQNLTDTVNTLSEDLEKEKQKGFCAWIKRFCQRICNWFTSWKFSDKSDERSTGNGRNENALSNVSQTTAEKEADATPQADIA